MKKFKIYGIVTGSKYIGVFDGKDAEDAIENAQQDGDCYVFLCHQCSGKEIDEPEIYKFEAEEVFSE